MGAHIIRSTRERRRQAVNAEMGSRPVTVEREFKSHYVRLKYLEVRTESGLIADYRVTEWMGEAVNDEHRSEGKKVLIAKAESRRFINRRYGGEGVQ
jgi:hypothetical protein